MIMFRFVYSIIYKERSGILLYFESEMSYQYICKYPTIFDYINIVMRYQLIDNYLFDLGPKSYFQEVGM
jgi:hypothetical protein